MTEVCLFVCVCASVATNIAIFPLAQAKRNRRSTGTKRESLNLKRVLQWISRYKVISLDCVNYGSLQYSRHERPHPLVLC